MCCGGVIRSIKANPTAPPEKRSEDEAFLFFKFRASKKLQSNRNFRLTYPLIFLSYGEDLIAGSLILSIVFFLLTSTNPLSSHLGAVGDYLLIKGTRLVAFSIASLGNGNPFQTNPPFGNDDDDKFIGTTTNDDDDDNVEGTTFVYLRGRLWKEQYLVIFLLDEGNKHSAPNFYG